MKLLLVVCLVAAVAAAPPPIRHDSSDDEDLQIIRYENYNEGVGNQRYAYETSDNSQQEQLDVLKDEGRDDTAAVQGSFTWISPKGDRYLIKYLAEKQEDPEDEPPGQIPPNVACSLLSCG